MTEYCESWLFHYGMVFVCTVLEHEFNASDNIAGQSVFCDDLVVIVLGFYPKSAVVSGVKQIMSFDGERPSSKGEHGRQPQVEVVKLILS